MLVIAEMIMVFVMDNGTAPDSNLVFTGDTQFSIRCGKCADIHNAQLDGKTNRSCECDCHNNNNYIPYCPPYVDPCCPTYPQPYYTTTCNHVPDSQGISSA